MSRINRSVSGNSAATALTGDITAGSPNNGSTFTVTNGSNYPSANFVVVIDRGKPNEEKVLCSARSSNVFTVGTSGRGFDGTTAADHASGATVEHILDAALVTALIAAINLLAGSDADPLTMYLLKTAHTKAQHDALLIDAATLQTHTWAEVVAVGTAAAAALTAHAGSTGDPHSAADYVKGTELTAALVPYLTTAGLAAAVAALDVDAHTLEGFGTSAFLRAGWPMLAGTTANTGAVIPTSELVVASVTQAADPTRTPRGYVVTGACGVIGAGAGIAYVASLQYRTNGGGAWIEIDKARAKLADSAADVPLQVSGMVPVQAAADSVNLQLTILRGSGAAGATVSSGAAVHLEAAPVSTGA